MVTAWLGHESHGVNALLPSVPRLKLDGDEDPEPPAVEIFNDVDFTVMDSAAGIIKPPTVPSLVVVSDGMMRDDEVAQPKKVGHEVPWDVGVGYYADGYREEGIVAGNYTLRAVLQSLVRFHGVRADGYRELNGVRAARITRLDMERTIPTVASTLVGMVFARMIVLNKLP
jgi:hypothetical protein